MTGGEIHSQSWKMVSFSKLLKNSNPSNCLDLLLQGKGRNIPNAEERTKAFNMYFCSIFGENSAVAVCDNKMLFIPAVTKEDVPTATQQTALWSSYLARAYKQKGCNQITSMF